MASARVLIVEDNEDNRIIYATYLRHVGCDVLEARTGTEGVATARASKPDIILMDVSLPELDGWTATRMLKEDPECRGIPIIVLTAHALEGDRARSAAAGADGYISKPAEPMDVANEVLRLLAAKAS